MTTRMTVTLPTDTYQQLLNHVQETGQSVSGFIREIAQRELERQQEEQKQRSYAAGARVKPQHSAVQFQRV